MESEAFRQLALEQIDHVHRMALHLAKDPNVAADLVQETYLKAFKAEGRFELREHGVKPWLFRILHNTFYTYIGKQKREMPVGEEAMLSGSMPSEQDVPPPAWDLAHLDWENVDDRLKHAIDALPDHQREVLLLWAIEGLKYREVADILGVALGTVMSRLYRARATLAESLQELAAEHGITEQNNA